MKRKMTALLLILSVVVSCLSSCRLSLRLPVAITRKESTDAVVDFFAWQLEAEVTEESLAAFDADRLNCVELYNSAAEEKADEFLQLLTKLDDYVVFANTQSDIAYWRYCCDLSDEAARQKYDEANSVYEQTKDKFWSSVGGMKREGNPLSQVATRFLNERYPIRVSSNSRSDEYQVKMIQIQNEMMRFNRTGTYEQVHGLYTDYLRQARLYAISLGYSNYYEYTNKVSLKNDYGQEEREAFREYVKKYLVPLYKVYHDRRCASDESLSPQDYLLSELYIGGSYYRLSGDPLGQYIASLPGSAGTILGDALKDGKILVGQGENALDSATASFIGQTPFCYFHENSTDLSTVSHVLGYYYADAYGVETQGITGDLVDLFAHGSNVLMLSCLDSKLQSAAFENARLYSLENMVYKAIHSTIRDEFNEVMFTTHNASDYTIEEINAVMQGLIDEYGVSEVSESMPRHLITYWNRLGLEDPFGLFGYATSTVVALQIYEMSLTDYEAASKCYCALVENAGIGAEFLQTVQTAGLKSPFDESVFADIAWIAFHQEGFGGDTAGA